MKLKVMVICFFPDPQMHQRVGPPRIPPQLPANMYGGPPPPGFGPSPMHRQQRPLLHQGRMMSPMPAPIVNRMPHARHSYAQGSPHRMM